MLRDRLGVGERWACRVCGQHRSTERYEPKRAEDDAVLRAELRKISKERPRWGYRRAHHRLGEEGWEVNRKRVQRLWREEGLRVPQRKRKRRRLGDSTVPASRLQAERPNHVWALDYQQDQTAEGRVIRVLNVVDEFTREALEMLVERSIDADTTVDVLERIVAERGAPEHLRMDNGPELTGHALREWCTLTKAGTVYIEPGSPWQNPYVESFHSRVRDELLDVEEFACLAEAKVVIEDWRQDYNRHRPHSSLGMLAPGHVRRAVDSARAVDRRVTRQGGAASAPATLAATPRGSAARLRDEGRAHPSVMLAPSGQSATFPAVISTTLSPVVDRQTGSGQRCDPPVELSLVDLPARPTVRAEGRPDPRPVRGPLGTTAA
jgi:putative transposase